MDRFQRIRVLGRGGSGTVWLVEDRSTSGPPVALKEVAPGGDPGVLRREFATLSSLRHPGLVRVLDFDLDPSGGARFTMEAVEGNDLAEAARREGGEAAIGLVAEALRALGFLHGFGLVHRDVKPQNLLVREEPRAGARLVVVDFGLSARRGLVGEGGAGLAGTLPYLAPELFDGAAASTASDLYALGVAVYESAHGRPPVVQGDRDLASFVGAVRSGRRARPALPEGWPAGLDAWLEQMLAPDPSDRPPSAREALARLNALSSRSFPLETGDTRAALLESGPPPGRERDVAAALEGLDPERFPGPRLVWICGDAGTGKSRLLRVVETEAVARGWRVIKPGPDDRSDVGAAVARWRERAREETTLVLLDEVEAWEGPAAALLDRIARERSAPPLRAVAAVRSQELRHAGLAKLLDDVGTVPSLARVDLGLLDDEAIEGLIERVGGVPSPARRSWLANAGERNAFATVHLLIEGAWERGGRRRPSAALDAAVAGRLRDLPVASRHVLDSVCAVGGDAPVAVVLEIAGTAGDDSPLRELTARGLVGIGEGTVSPASRALASHVRERLAPDRARSLCRLAAERIAAADDGELHAERIARLWKNAGEPEQALPWSERAAEIALAARRPEEAASHLAFGAALLDPRDPRRYGWRRRQGEALLDAGRAADAARALGGAARVASSEADRAWARVRQAYAVAIANRWGAAADLAETAVASVGETASPRLRAERLRVLAIRDQYEGRSADARENMDAAFRLASETDDPMFRAEVLQNLAAIHKNLETGAAAETATEAIAACREAGHTVALVKALITRGQAHGRSQQHARAGTDLREALRLAEENGLQELKLHVVARLVAVTADAGELSATLRFARSSVEEAEYLGSGALLPNAVVGLAETYQILGRTAEAVSLCEEAFRRWGGSTDPFFTVYGRLVHAGALLESTPPDFRTSRDLIAAAREEALRFQAPRPLASAILAEIERRVLAGEPRPGEMEEEFRHLLAADPPLAPEFRLRWSLCEAERLLGEEAFEEALRNAEEGAGIARESLSAAFESRALHLAARAHGASHRVAQATDARRAAREALDRAAAKIADADDRRSFLARPVFRGILDPDAGPSSEVARLGALYEMIRALNSQTDPEVLLAESLDMALRAVHAERGMILLADDAGGFSVRLSRNLEDETVADAEAYSKSIATQAGEGKSILALDAGNDERFKDLRSISLYRIRSLMCVPLRSRGTIVGTVYLDSRREGRLFSQDDLRFVEAFADHAALALGNARARARLEEENRRLRAVAGERTSFDNLVGRSEAMQEVFSWLDTVSRSELPVLVTGESGTGKELVARSIHFHGPRKHKTFLSENCAAIPESLLESALFGHVRGAFTGADRDRQGLFEQADGGTLFLDEVGDMPAAMQARLLRVLQEGEVRRVGDEEVGHVDVRVIAATNKDLEMEIRAGNFREDLFYRLNVLSLRMPPLRERSGDVAFLSGRLLERIAKERRRPAPRVDVEVLDLLEKYHWPGNVRQLENVLQRLALLAGDGPVTVATVRADDGLRRTFLGERPAAVSVLSLARTEEEQIRRALQETGGNRDRAAKMLGISRATIYRKLKEYGIR